jgi:hypothetical protein
VTQPTTERIAICCSACGATIRTVPAGVAAAFASGSWFCADPECFARRTAATVEAEGKLL